MELSSKSQAPKELAWSLSPFIACQCWGIGHCFFIFHLSLPGSFVASPAVPESHPWIHTVSPGYGFASVVTSVPRLGHTHSSKQLCLCCSYETTLVVPRSHTAHDRPARRIEAELGNLRFSHLTASLLALKYRPSSEVRSNEQPSLIRRFGGCHGSKTKGQPASGPPF